MNLLLQLLLMDLIENQVNKIFLFLILEVVHLMFRYLLSTTEFLKLFLLLEIPILEVKISINELWNT